MGVDKRAIIEDITFGGRTAEDEVEKLSKYFVETEQWRKVWADEVDIVFAPKGGGKSAIYSMLGSREDQLFTRNVILVQGENPPGNTAFESITAEPPTSEAEFTRIWRLYFLILIVEELEQYEVKASELAEVRAALASLGLAEPIAQKKTIVARVRDIVTRLFSPEALEGNMTLDPVSGAPAGFALKVSFDEPTVEQSKAGVLSVDNLYEKANAVLAQQGFTIWLMLDRLDVAFTESPELEANALRALFRVYRLLGPLKQLRLKIFLRSDIWSEITKGGFRETSHITRDLNLQWGRASLLQLITQRMVQSSRLIEYLGGESEAVIASTSAQQALFDAIFPKQVDAGSRKPTTFDWALSRTDDGNKVNAPRELIHLFSEVRDAQLNRLDTGEASIPQGTLFEAQTFREAWPLVSETRLVKTIYPEFPWLRDWLEALRGQRTHQNLDSLQAIWGVGRAEAEERLKRLVDVGFFERRGQIQQRTYWVPFLYRPALELVQGSADGVTDTVQEDDRIFDDPDEVADMVAGS